MTAPDRPLARALRATGADPPGGDPRAAHPGVAMEGYFWRLTDPAAGRVVVALAGVCRDAAGAGWANVALAAHPGGVVAERVVDAAWTDPDGLGVRAAGALEASAEGLRVDLGPGARLEVAFAERRGWTGRLPGGLGLAHRVPGLSQYWHPHLLGARVRGHAELAGVGRVPLDGAHAYAEKNWGRGGFPPRWWWGQAQGFERCADDLCVAFAGGVLQLGPARPAATALAVRLGDDLVAFAPPVGLVRARVSPGRWRLDARSPRWRARIDARADDAPVTLSVPLPRERRTTPHAHQHLAGRLRLELWRGGRLHLRDEARLAGLERGTSGA